MCCLTAVWVSSQQSECHPNSSSATTTQQCKMERAAQEGQQNLSRGMGRGEAISLSSVTAQEFWLSVLVGQLFFPLKMIINGWLCLVALCFRTPCEAPPHRFSTTPWKRQGPGVRLPWIQLIIQEFYSPVGSLLWHFSTNVQQMQQFLTRGFLPHCSHTSTLY